MSEKHDAGGDDYLSAREMRQWARQEMKDARKALELRIKDITTLVSAYSARQLTAAEADEMYARYRHRWGEALHGATVGDGVPDAEILARIDEARGPFIKREDLMQKYRQLFGNAAEKGRSR